jgi:hypothetical protein
MPLVVPMALAKKAGSATLSTKVAPSAISSVTPVSVAACIIGMKPPPAQVTM